MLAHELSKLTCLDPEAIRVYRNKGLVKPVQNPDNHYFEYDYADAAVLSYLQLLRIQNISLDNIHSLFNPETSNIDEVLQQEIAAIHNQIDSLQKRLTVLETLKKHVAETPKTNRIVIERTIARDKYDFYKLDEVQAVKKACLKELAGFSTTLSFDASSLNHLQECEKIKVSMGIGLYEDDLQTIAHFPVKNPVVTAPKGTYLLCTIATDSIEAIDAEQLRFVIEYAKKNHYRFEGPMTAYIVKVDYSQNKPIIHFRLRFLVRKDSE